MKKRYWIALLAFAALFVVSCAGNREEEEANGESGFSDPTPADTSGQAEAADPSLDFLNGSYAIVRGDLAPSLTVKAAAALYRALSEETGVNIPIVTDYVKNEDDIPADAWEILVGETNRPASAALRSTLEPGTFAISTTEKQLLVVGYDDLSTYYGVRYLIQEYVEGTNGFTLPKHFSYVSEPLDLSPSALLNETDRFTLVLTERAEIPQEEHYRYLQGGIVTGDYAYMTLANGEDFPENAPQTYLIKYTLDPWEEVCRSESLPLDHANDLAYLPQTNELYVVSCSGHPKRVSIFDADTLTLKEQRDVDGDYGCYALDYNESREKFVSATGSTSMCLYDKELNFLDYHEGVSTTHVGQGIGSDDRYVYHVLYSANETVPHTIYVYNWSGHFVTKIPFELPGCEPENISIVGDKIYIGCNNDTWSGGVLYEAVLLAE